MVCFSHNFVRIQSVPRRVLVVEDEPVALKTMTRLLTISDYDVLSASNLARANDQLVWQPDFVLLDLLLPDGPGTQLLARIRKLDPAPMVAVLTGTFDQVLADAIRLGPDAVFRKPVDLPSLLEWMKNPRPFVFKSPAPRIDTRDYCI
jgi:CheY-like chemotaxis protein